MSVVSVRGLLAVICTAAALLVPLGGVGHADQPGGGQVTVRGNQLLRDGQPWVPHGFYQIAFEVAPGNLARADHPFWANAYRHYTPAEYRAMRGFGADSVRLQIAQAGADPRSPLFDRGYLDTALGAVQAARDAGLTVMVSIQDESHVPGDRPVELPDDGTRRVWQQVAPRFGHDRGVLYELLNEPRPAPNAANWRRWAQAMNSTVRTVRDTGARNVVIADGLQVGRVINGAPPLADPQVAYAAHPYALRAGDQTDAAWDAALGRVATRAPVIITEWMSGSYYCDADTPVTTVRTLRYLDRHRIGLEVGAWDWTSGGFGSARWQFPRGTTSRFAGLACRRPGYGLGAVVHAWYSTGVPATSPL